MQQQKAIRQGLQSTKVTIKQEDPDILESTERTNVIFATIEPGVTRKTYGDLTGRYPTISASGNQYVLVVYDLDSSVILAEPMKNRTKGEILRCYKAIHKVLAKNGFKPKLQVMDNEASRVLCDYIAKNDIELQLAPPYMHRQNLAERAIRLFKEHFKAF